jgi:pimeloyl-ACP methyl ester carboxylesterase
VRLIAVDRPGYGATDADPVGDASSLARDVEALGDELGLDTFAVLGWSAGGPGALACGALLGSRVTAVGVAAGIAPRDTTDDIDVDAFAKEGAPWVVPLPIDFDLALEYIVEGKDPAYVGDLGSVIGLHEAMAHALVAAVDPGVAGIELDLRTSVTRWPFALDAINRPVLLWYGTSDTVTPVSDGELLAQRMPQATLSVVEGASHLLPLVRWTELLSEVVSAGWGR